MNEFWEDTKGLIGCLLKATWYAAIMLAFFGVLGFMVWQALGIFK